MTAIPTFVPPAAELEPAAGLDPKDVLFIGAGKTAVGWYRCYLPAMFLGSDWIGVGGHPPQLQYHTGLVKGKTQLAAFDSYKVVVIQQPRGRGWLKVIRDLQARGVKVLYEVDDYLHAIHKMKDHDFADYYGPDTLKAVELCMGVCDGVICSTEYIARRYKRFAKRTFVCENGIDTARYDLTRPSRPTINIGWAGATGHRKAVLPWLERVGSVMLRHPEVCFVSIGQPWARALQGGAFGPSRAISIPFTMLDTYPSAMTLFDVAIAPAGRGGDGKLGNFFKGKSDLRWVEASALGIPVIGDPEVYRHIAHGETGFHATTPDDLEEQLELLVADPDLRIGVGTKARDEVRRTRDMKVMARQWLNVFEEVL